MSLTTGTRLGPYEIVSVLGAGGMGEVYRARDTKLDRSVAVKILPESFAHDPERLARFEREAKTLASLNHPNIAIIHGFEEAGRRQVSLWTFSLQDKKAAAFSEVRSMNLFNAVFSPDERWVAYTWRMTDTTTLAMAAQVYVEPFPATGAKYQISRRWSSSHLVARWQGALVPNRGG